MSLDRGVRVVNWNDQAPCDRRVGEPMNASQGFGPFIDVHTTLTTSNCLS